jgi:hypothetical protein
VVHRHVEAAAGARMEESIESVLLHRS